MKLKFRIKRRQDDLAKESNHTKEISHYCDISSSDDRPSCSKGIHDSEESATSSRIDEYLIEPRLVLTIGVV